MADLRRHHVQMVGRDPLEEHRASTPLELLFDLSFVVAISVSAGQLHHEVVAAHFHDGIVGYLATFFGTWWAWMNFTWFASSFDTDDVTYRLQTFVQIFGVLVLAVGIPDAYGGDFHLVTFGYVIMRLAMVTFWLRAARGSEDRRSAAIRYAVGIAVVQVFWVGRLYVLEDHGIWTLALLVLAELAVPAIAEPSASGTAWHPEHISERYGLFTIIVIGESILAATRAIRTALDGGFSVELLTIAGGGMVLVFGLWWIYFERNAHEGLVEIGRGAFLWGYGHFVLFAALAALGAGIAVAAEVPEAGHELAISPVGQALAVAIPAGLALATMAALQAFVHKERFARTARLVGAAALIVVIGAISQIPLGVDVALMGLVMALIVAVDVVIMSDSPATNVTAVDAPEPA